MDREKLIGPFSQQQFGYVLVTRRRCQMQWRIAVVDKKFEAVDKRFDQMDRRLLNLEKGQGNIEKRLSKVEATMVTKDYLDEKLADLRGDLVVLMRKEDNKVRKLVDILMKRQVLSAQEADEILSMEPFPDLGLHLSSQH